MTYQIGILGGTGPAGRGLAIRLASAGYRVIIGGRDAERSVAVALGLVPRGSGTINGGSNEDAAAAEVVVVATPWDSAVDTVKSAKVLLEGKVVISMVNALQKEGRELVPMYPPRGSMAAQIAFALPLSRIAGAFHHLPASDMENLDSGINADVIIFGDDVDARRVTMEITNAITGLRAIEAGSMSLASPVEAFTAVCISINIRHKAHTYVRLAGMPDA